MRHRFLTFTAAFVLVAPAVASSADTVGFVDPETVRWQVQAEDGSLETFYFGLPGDIPIAGDWDCNGVDSAGMWRSDTGLVYLQDEVTGVADRQAFFGAAGDVPLAGDWDGDGCDTLGVYRKNRGRVLLSNDFGPSPDLDYYFGIPSDKPFVGDFDEDGVDEIGLHRESSGFVYLRMTHTLGVADSEFFYGVPQDRLVAGDWDNDGDDTVAVFRPSERRFYLRNDNSLGFADDAFDYAEPDAIPVAGNLRVFVPPEPKLELEPEPRSFTVAASGDLLIHSAVREAAAAYADWAGYDFSPMLEPVADIISAADLGICHLEVPLSPDNTGLSSYPQFNAPHELADAIAEAGYDTCSIASNHTIDKGETGVRNTLGVLDAAGVQHTGSARGPEEDVPNLYVVNGVHVGHLSYTYGLNGLRVPPGKDWMVNVIDVDAILTDAAAAKERGAEFVIVSMHWGIEYNVDPTTTQQQQAEAILSSPDVDLILGHHAHVIQPVGMVGEEYVVYGMGNFLSNQRSGNVRVGTEDGVIVEVLVEEQPDGSFAATAVEYTPTFVEAGTFRILPVAPTLNGPAIDSSLEAALQTSWDRTQDRFNRLGTVGVAPTEVPE